MALVKLETKWKAALTSILEELTEPELRKLLFNLDKIPQGLKADKHLQDLPYLIVQYYGTEESIIVVDREMKRIPRNDADVQELLRPFVEKMKKKVKNPARKSAADPGSVGKKQTPAADPGSVGKKKTPAADPGSVGKKKTPAADPGSVGKKQTPAADPGSVGKKRTPAADPGSVGKKQTPAADPGSVGKKRTPVADPGSVGKKQTPVADPGSVGKKKTPAADPGSVGKKRTPAADPGSVGKKQTPAPGTKRKREDDGLKDEAPHPSEILGQGRSCQLDRGRNAQWKKSIRDIKSGGIRETEGFQARVVQKSGLRLTKDRKFYFFLAVADETASVMVIIFEKGYYEKIKEDSSYMFHGKLIKDKDVVKVTVQSKVWDIKSVDVPEELLLEARELLYPERPVDSVKKAKRSEKGAEVSVQGSVTRIDPVGKIKVNHKRQMIKRQSFLLTDETDSVQIVMWGEGAVQQSKGLSIGDVVKVTNTKVNKYLKTISLDSTGFTTIHKVQSVGIQKVRIEILGISKATKKETHLETELNQQVQTFVVATRCLAKAFDFKPEGDFKEKLLKEMPCSAEAEIQGVKIIKITVA